MIDPDKLMELAKIFDRPGVRVLGELPRNIKLGEVIGIQASEGKTTKVTIRRENVLYLCWIENKDCIDTIIRLKEEIAKRPSWEDRWEPWELYGSTEPLEMKKRILRSRLVNSEERQSFDGDFIA